MPSIMSSLTTTQVANLSTLAISRLALSDIAAMDTAQAAALTSIQVPALSTASIAALSTAQLATFDTKELHALTTAQISKLTTSQVAAMTSADLNAFDSAQLPSLGAAAFGKMTSDQLAAIDSAEIGALTTAQLSVISTDGMLAFDSAEISALTTQQITAMTTTQIGAISAAQVPGFGTEDIAALHVAGKDGAFSSSAVGAMSQAQVDQSVISPIALDLDGNGIQTVGVAHGVSFDMANIGVKQHVGWVTGKDGFLVRDLNHDGIINNGSEMFGTATTLASGERAQDGFAALESLDSNHDGIINSQDAVYNELKVWIDANQDGVSQATEMQTLQSLGIEQLNLNATHTAVNNSGNWELLNSTYTTTDGQAHQMADIWFQYSSQIDISSLSTDQISSLTPQQVHLLSTDQIAAMSPDQVAAMTSTDIVALSQEQVKALSVDDIAALHNLGKDDVLTTPQLQALIKPHLAASGLDDVLFSGNVHVHTNADTASGQIQMVVSGDATGHVDLVGPDGDWKDAGSLLVNGAESHVYTSGHTQIVIQGSVTVTEKNLLLG